MVLIVYLSVGLIVSLSVVQHRQGGCDFTLRHLAMVSHCVNTPVVSHRQLVGGYSLTASVGLIVNLSVVLHRQGGGVFSLLSCVDGFSLAWMKILSFLYFYHFLFIFCFIF